MSRLPVIPGELEIIGIQPKPALPDRWSMMQPAIGPGGTVVKAGGGAVAELPKYDDPARSDRRSPLVDILPQFATIEAWFDGALPAYPAPFAIETGHSAWFGLQSVRVPDDVGQELSLYQIAADLLPSDSDGTGGANSVAWGNTKGTGAAIVIGPNLPADLGSWKSAPAFIPRVETSGTGILTTGRLSRTVRVLPLPSGKYTDATPQRMQQSISFAPGAWRFPRGSTLDIALVVRSTQAAGAGTRIIYGSGYVALTVLRTESRSDFSQ